MSNVRDLPAFLRQRRLLFARRLRQKGVRSLSGASVLRQAVRELGAGKLALGADAAGPPHVDESSMTATFTITTPRRDRVGDVVVPRGCEHHLDNYRANPQVFFSHRSEEFPVARCQTASGAFGVSVADDEVLATGKFHEETEEARVTWRLVCKGLLTATSIGFLPVVASVVDPDDYAGEGEWDGEDVIQFPDDVATFPSLKFLEWDLLEWSVVPVPANPDCAEAYAMHLSRGHVDGAPIPLGVRRSLEAFALKGKVWSPGFDPTKVKFTGTLLVGGNQWEYKEGSLVRIDDVSLVAKDAPSEVEPEEKGVIPYASHPKAPEDKEWDAAAEVKKADVADLKKMCAWYADRGEDKSDYKLPHHTAEGCKTVWAGVRAAMAALLGARGGTKIPEADRKGVFSHLKRHYEEFDKPVPDFHKSYTDAELDEIAGVSVTKSLTAPGDDNADPLRWNKALSKKFDVEKEKLRPSTAEYALIAKFLGCAVKEIYEAREGVPSTRMGSFLLGWRDATAPFKLLDTRNVNPSGSESPPSYEVIPLGPDKSEEFLVDASRFYEAPDGTKHVVTVFPTWFGLGVQLYSKSGTQGVLRNAVEKSWELARGLYNFLRGQAFSLSGEFLPRTKEAWGDVFVSPENEKALSSSIKALNDKKAAFANRGAVFMGPPGTGKTLSGRVIRNTAEATFIWVSARDFYRAGAFGGFSYAFDLARELAPSVIFFEDVDNWLSERTVDLLKTEMDGVSRSSGVWTILTTNFPEELPEALIDRPGRFHDVLQFDLPDAGARAKMVARWLPDLDPSSPAFQKAVAETSSYSGAYVYELCHFAKTLAEQESLALPEAVGRALDKIRAQKELVASRGNRPARKSLSLSLTKSLDLSPRYRLRKAMPENKDALPSPQDGTDAIHKKLDLMHKALQDLGDQHADLQKSHKELAASHAEHKANSERDHEALKGLHKATHEMLDKMYSCMAPEDGKDRVDADGDYDGDKAAQSRIAALADSVTRLKKLLEG